MKRLFLLLFCILTFSLCGEVLARENMSQKGFTIKTVEDLYVLCKQAKEEYKDNPKEIGNSVCGAYIQGVIGGYSFSAINIISAMPEPPRMHYLEEFKKNNCVDFEVSLYMRVLNFIEIREQNIEFNDAAFSGVMGSIIKSKQCLSKGIDFYRKWEKYNGDDRD